MDRIFLIKDSLSILIVVEMLNSSTKCISLLSMKNQYLEIFSLLGSGLNCRYLLAPIEERMQEIEPLQRSEEGKLDALILEEILRNIRVRDLLVKRLNYAGEFESADRESVLDSISQVAKHEEIIHHALASSYMPVCCYCQIRE